MTALERQWAAKLKASGFTDLEGSDRDGPLSDRGNLHPVSETGEEITRLGQRVEDGHAFTAWAQSILHAHRFKGAQQREVWRLYAEGTSEADISEAVGIKRHWVRRHLAAVKARVGQVREVRKQWRNKKRQDRAGFRGLLRRCDEQTLRRLAAVLLLGLTQRRRATAPSP